MERWLIHDDHVSLSARRRGADKLRRHAIGCINATVEVDWDDACKALGGARIIAPRLGNSHPRNLKVVHACECRDTHTLSLLQMHERRERQERQQRSGGAHMQLPKRNTWTVLSSV